MKPLAAPIEREPRQGDGQLSVTLLALLGVLASFVVFGLTNRYLIPQDGLYGRLPADNVAVYLHLNASRLSAPAATLLLPENVRADEIARFALMAEDRTLVWGTLFGWQAGHRPSDAEISSLAAAGAVRIDDRTHFLGDRRLEDHFAAADPRITTLAADIAVSRALNTVRGLAPLQVYFDPKLLSQTRKKETADLLNDAEPLVFAMNIDMDSVYAVAMPVLTATDFPAWLGFAPHHVPGGRAAAVLSESPILTLSGSRSVIDPLAVMFQKIETARRATGLDRTGQLIAAEADLRLLLDRPAVLSLFSDQDDRGPGFSASYPGLQPDRLVDAMTNYAGAALLQKTTLILPDEDNAVELRFDPAKFTVTDMGDIKALEIADIGMKLYLGAAPGGGTALASDPLLLPVAGPDKAALALNGRCRSITGTKLTVNRPILASLSRMLESTVARIPLALSALDSALFIDNGHGTIVGCGYFR